MTFYVCISFVIAGLWLDLGPVCYYGGAAPRWKWCGEAHPQIRVACTWHQRLSTSYGSDLLVWSPSAAQPVNADNLIHSLRISLFAREIYLQLLPCRGNIILVCCMYGFQVKLHSLHCLYKLPRYTWWLQFLKSQFESKPAILVFPCLWDQLSK